MIEKIASIIGSIAQYMAVAAGGSASYWGTYQPKEPESVQKFIK